MRIVTRYTPRPTARPAPPQRAEHSVSVSVGTGQERASVRNTTDKLSVGIGTYPSPPLQGVDHLSSAVGAGQERALGPDTP